MTAQMTGPTMGLSSAPGRNPLLVVSGIAGLVAGALALVSVPMDLYEDQLSIWDTPSTRWFCLLFGIGLLGAGLLLLAQPATQTAGAAMLPVVVALFATFPARAIVFTLSDPGLDAGSGLYLLVAALGVGAGGAAIAAVGLIARAAGGPPPVLEPARVALAALAGAAGYLAAVGFAMNPVALEGTDLPQGNPFAGFSPRSMWAQVLTVSLLVLAPIVAVFVTRAAAAGITAGVGVFIVAEFAYRLEFGAVSGAPDLYRSIEGTWWFLAGGLAVLAALLIRLGVVRDGTRRSAPVLEPGR